MYYIITLWLATIMVKNITILAYRANYDDYCRGCHMGSSDSNFEYNSFTSADAAATYIADFMFEDYINKDDLTMGDYEITILFDGVSEDTYKEEFNFSLQKTINDKALEIYNIKKDEYIVKKARKHADDEAEKKAQKVKEDLAKLAELQKQYTDK